LISVFDYTEPHGFLSDIFEDKKRRNSAFSLRAWAKQMQLKSHSHLSQWLNGKKDILPSHIPQINSSLNLDDKELKFFEAMVCFYKAQGAQRDFYERQMFLFHPDNESVYLNEQYFEIISKWLHMAILEMTNLPGFKSEAEWIQKRLLKKYSLKEIEDALERLIGMGLLSKVENTLVKTNKRLTTPKDRPHVAIQNHHREVLEMASDFISKQDVQERCYDTCTMTIDSSRLEEAKKLVIKFRQDMSQLLESSEGDKTYQLAIQLFRVSE
jgi:uncharacterized protein (TIGR02147 family)